MATVFLARPYGRFINIQSKLRRESLHETNQGPNFLGGNFSNRDNLIIDSPDSSYSKTRNAFNMPDIVQNNVKNRKSSCRGNEHD